MFRTKEALEVLRAVQTFLKATVLLIPAMGFGQTLQVIELVLDRARDCILTAAEIDTKKIQLCSHLHAF